jgi:hypothetical protein
MSKLRYLNSPSWREGGRNIAALLFLSAFFLSLICLAVMLTGGDR